MSERNPSQLLRISLFSNSVFSAVSGLTFVAASASISSLIGLEFPLILLAIGVSLLGFAALLTFNALRRSVSLIEAWLAVVLDLLWVACSILVLVTGFLTTNGNLMVVVIATIVLLFAFLQFQGIRRLRPAV